MNARRWTACAGCFLFFSLLASAGTTRSISVTTEGHRPLERCDDIKIRFGDWSHPLQMATVEQTLESGSASLRATLGESEGISVRGWDEDRTVVRVCKAAGASSEEAARKLLDAVEVKLEGGALSVDGPGGNWTVYLLVRAPRKTNIDLEAMNGAIAVEGISGSVSTRTRNGPVAVKNCPGTVVVRAENGPIDLVGQAGSTSLAAENGPISVVLEGTRWQGEGLTARTENGPMSLTLPRDYASGVDVRSTGHSPFACRAEQCDDARKTWDDDLRRVVMGSSPAAVRLSTVNGPVSVESNRPRRKLI